jgi:hypothetical protein
LRPRQGHQSSYERPRSQAKPRRTLPVQSHTLRHTHTTPYERPHELRPPTLQRHLPRGNLNGDLHAHHHDRRYRDINHETTTATTATTSYETTLPVQSPPSSTYKSEPDRLSSGLTEPQVPANPTLVALHMEKCGREPCRTPLRSADVIRTQQIGLSLCHIRGSSRLDLPRAPPSHHLPDAPAR